MPGLATTFEVLANTANDAAAAVLVTALDASLREVPDLALAALLARRNATAELFVLRRWADLPQRWKQQIADRPGWLTTAIHTAIVNRDAKLYECGCAAAVFTRDYDVIPSLATAAADMTNPFAAQAAIATAELTELLADELTTPRDYRVRRDPSLQREHVLANLERFALSFAEHGRSELLEAFLLLAGRENAVLKRILQSPSDRLFGPVMDVLTSSTRPGIERLLASYLDDPHAPLSAMHAIGKRADLSFLRQAARKIGPEPAAVVRANLRRIDGLKWVAKSVSLVDALRDSEQAGIVQLAVACAAPRPLALQVIDYILRHGKVIARRIAARALADFEGPAANDLTLHILKDDDPDVRAAGARQLRPRNLPGAIQQLLSLIESPHAVEREAAHAGLAEFTFERFSANFEQMTPQARAVAGALVRRVDTQAIDRVRAELVEPSRSRRKRGLELALSLESVAALMDEIAALLKDDDQYLRIDAIRALATADSERTRQLLRTAMLDTQPLVQQAAESAMAELARREVGMSGSATRETVRLSTVFSPAVSPTPGSEVPS